MCTTQLPNITELATGSLTGGKKTFDIGGFSPVSYVERITKPNSVAAPAAAPAQGANQSGAVATPATNPGPNGSPISGTPTTAQQIGSADPVQASIALYSKRTTDGF